MPERPSAYFRFFCKPSIGATFSEQILINDRVVFVRSSIGANDDTQCLGYFYTQDWVLTAKHCIMNVDMVRVESGRWGAEARELRLHPSKDLALVRVVGSPTWALPPPVLRTSAGSWVVLNARSGGAPNKGLLGARVDVYARSKSVLRARGMPAPCFGDSGAPMIDDDGSLIAVLSRGAAGCTGRDEYTLVSGDPWLQRAFDP